MIITETTMYAAAGAHAELGGALAATLEAAETDLVAAREADEIARATVESLDLASTSKAKIQAIRLDAEITAAKLLKAKRAEAAARSDLEAYVPEADAAEAMLPMLRVLTGGHPRIAIHAVPVAAAPEDHSDPVLIAHQATRSVAHPSGALEADVVLTLHRDAGLHCDLLSGRAIIEAAERCDVVLRSGDHTAEQLDMRIMSDEAQQRVTLRVIAWPAVPTVSAAPDPQGLADSVAAGFRRHLDDLGLTANVGGTAEVSRTTREAGIIERTVRGKFSVATSSMDPTELLERFEWYLQTWADTPEGSLGRIVAVKLVDRGRPEAGNGAAGGRWLVNGIVAEFVAVAAG